MTYRVCLGGEKTLPCTEEEEEALPFFFIISNYCSLTTLFRRSRSPFLTSRRRTVWEWHKRSLRVNTRLQRESAINKLTCMIFAITFQWFQRNYITYIVVFVHNDPCMLDMCSVHLAYIIRLPIVYFWRRLKYVHDVRWLVLEVLVFGFFACVRACVVRAYVSACVHACMCVCMWVSLCVREHVAILFGTWWMADYETQPGFICVCGMERYIINYTS